MPTPVQSFFGGPSVWYDDAEIWNSLPEERAICTAKEHQHSVLNVSGSEIPRREPVETER